MSSPVIIHIPHASAVIPKRERTQLAISDDDLRQELLRMTDWYTDKLFDLGEKATSVVFDVSRLIVDPERFDDDAAEPMAAKGMGAVYTKTANGRPLRSSLDAKERQRLLQRYYMPHHDRLERLVRKALDTSGHCLIIDAHSFPSKPLCCDADRAPHRPDICLGTDSFYTPDCLADAAERAFREMGWRVELDRPYDGTMVPSSFLLHKDPRVHSIMVEVNRSLYMNEDTGERSAGFGEVRRKIRSALESITASVR